MARFIIEDLDRAIELMSLTTDNGKNRLTKNVALLFKSRVALFEATWLKYHKGTDRVPGGPGWPGAQQEYNAGFSIDIDKEVDWFLEQAMDASAQVADRISLTKIPVYIIRTRILITGILILKCFRLLIWNR